jgi:hypothetical protein
MPLELGPEELDQIQFWRVSPRPHPHIPTELSFRIASSLRNASDPGQRSESRSRPSSAVVVGGKINGLGFKSLAGSDRVFSLVRA